ncbi:hypothetical protein AXG93_4008s1000 [Marchantia polymorpha subsp. ruderalis]|uniref:Uncharacterized protein n=1 Tax=Marchantia polymorpha subsp. ruderalis TaxID=1480154 RepID=A0A176W7X1_MARPO|nr:hypothetical protein AXG93_4008s1000 [Marchantia polymorpha subsp. ruderalis]
MRLRQGKSTSSLDYTFGGTPLAVDSFARAPLAQALLMLDSAFGGGSNLRLRWKHAPSVEGNTYKGKRLRRYAERGKETVRREKLRRNAYGGVPSAEAERTKKSAQDVSLPQAPSAVDAFGDTRAENSFGGNWRNQD